MTAKRSRPIRAMHCIQWQLENPGNAGSTALGLLEFQSSSYYSQLPKNPENPLVWETSRKVLDIELANQCSPPLDAFKNIKDRATTGAKPVPERGVLYAVMTVADSLSPENVPLRIACALHLGGLIPWEIENDANCYELVEHAVDLFLAQRKVSQSRDHERFDFVFQGGSFHAKGRPSYECSCRKCCRGRRYAVMRPSADVCTHPDRRRRKRRCGKKP